MGMTWNQKEMTIEQFEQVHKAQDAIMDELTKSGPLPTSCLGPRVARKTRLSDMVILIALRWLEEDKFVELKPEMQQDGTPSKYNFEWHFKPRQ